MWTGISTFNLTKTCITWKLRIVCAKFTDTPSSKDVKETARYPTVLLEAALDEPNPRSNPNYWKTASCLILFLQSVSCVIWKNRN